MRRIAGATAIAGSAIAIAAFSTSDAPDATAAGGCPNNSFCVYEHSNGGGRMAAFRAGSGSPDLNRQGLNDKVSSIENRTNGLWCLFKDTNFRDAVGYIDGRTAGPLNLRAAGSDEISSVRAC